MVNLISLVLYLLYSFKNMLGADYNLRTEDQLRLPFKTLPSFRPKSGLDYDATICNFLFKNRKTTNAENYLKKVAVEEDNEALRLHAASNRLLQCVTESRMDRHDKALEHARSALTLFEKLLVELATKPVQQEGSNQRKGKGAAKEAIRGKLFARECIAIEEEFCGLRSDMVEFGRTFPSRHDRSPSTRASSSPHSDVDRAPPDIIAWEDEEKKEREVEKSRVINELDALDLARRPEEKEEEEEEEEAEAIEPEEKETKAEDTSHHELREENLRVAKRYFPADKKLRHMMRTSLERIHERHSGKSLNWLSDKPGDLESVTSEDRRMWNRFASLPTLDCVTVRRTVNEFSQVNEIPRVVTQPGDEQMEELMLNAYKNPYEKKGKNDDGGRRLAHTKHTKREASHKGDPFQKFKEEIDTRRSYYSSSRPRMAEENFRWTRSDFRSQQVQLRIRLKEKTRHDLYDEKVWFSDMGHASHRKKMHKTKYRDFIRRNDNDEARRQLAVRHEITTDLGLNLNDDLQDQFRDTTGSFEHRKGKIEHDHQGKKGRKSEQKNMAVIRALGKLLDVSAEKTIAHAPESEHHASFGAARERKITEGERRKTTAKRFKRSPRRNFDLHISVA